MTTRPCPPATGSARSSQHPCVRVLRRGPGPLAAHADAQGPRRRRHRHPHPARRRGRGRRRRRPGRRPVRRDRVARTPTFTRRGDDLHCTVELPMTAAALGTTLQLDTLRRRRRRSTSQPGTQSGEVITLRGLGVTHLRGGGRGDLTSTSRSQTPDPARRRAGASCCAARHAARRGAPGGPARAARHRPVRQAARRLPCRPSDRAALPARPGALAAVGAGGTSLLDGRRGPARRARCGGSRPGERVDVADGAGRALRAVRDASTAGAEASRPCCVDALDGHRRRSAAVRPRAGAGQGRPRRAGRRDGDRARRRRGRAVAGRARSVVVWRGERAAQGARALGAARCARRPSSPGAPGCRPSRVAADRRARRAGERRRARRGAARGGDRRRSRRLELPDRGRRAARRRPGGRHRTGVRTIVITEPGTREDASNFASGRAAMRSRRTD